MMKNINKLYLYALGLLCALGLNSCDLFDNPDAEAENLVRIYDNDRFNFGYFPLDVEQTSTGGFLVLSEFQADSSDFRGVHMLLADEDGEFLTERELPQSTVSPTENLMKIGQAYYFFAMNNTTLFSKLMQANEEGQVIEVAETDLEYPLAASLNNDGSGFVLLQYNRGSRESAIHQVSTSGDVSASQGFTIGVGEFEVEPDIIDHLTRRGRILPFMAGHLGGNSYYFNGFYEFTVSLVFVDFSSGDGDDPGVVQGFRTERAISSLAPLGGDIFALSRYGFGDNFILPNEPLETAPGSIASSNDLVGNPFPELTEDARVQAHLVQVDGRDVVLYASDTKGKQIILMAYDPASGVLLGTRNLGFTNPYEFGGLSLTEDGGLVVVGTTFVAGRFPRIALFRLSPGELSSLASL